MLSSPSVGCVALVGGFIADGLYDTKLGATNGWFKVVRCLGEVVYTVAEMVKGLGGDSLEPWWQADYSPLVRN